MSRVANSYWVDERIKTQRVSPRTNSLASVQQISLDIIGTRTEVRRRGGVLPSWVVCGMILLATLAVCVTVNMRTRTKVQVAAQQLTVMQTDVEALRSMNQWLKSELERLRTDPRTIELTARPHLNMVRSNEFVVPVDADVDVAVACLRTMRQNSDKWQTTKNPCPRRSMPFGTGRT